MVLHKQIITKFNNPNLPKTQNLNKTYKQPPCKKAKKKKTIQEKKNNLANKLKAKKNLPL
jgi:hypothetical protein